MLHEKLFYIKQKKVDVARKNVSWWQKQDDAPQKDILCSKKLLTFLERRDIYLFSTVLHISDFPW